MWALELALSCRKQRRELRAAAREIGYEYELLKIPLFALLCKAVRSSFSTALLQQNAELHLSITSEIGF